MHFTESDVLRLCPSRRVFDAGKRYFESGRIKKLEKDRINSDETYISARVKGTHMYNVTVWLEGGSFSHQLCDCPAFHKYDGICKHIAAVLIHCADKTAPASGEKTVSSAEISKIIRDYTQLENAVSIDTEKSEKMTLIPQLHLVTSTDLRISFKVGGARKYIIKDLCEFKRCIDRCEYFSYGKSFGFLHTKSIFDGRSQKLLGLIDRAVSENEIFNSAYNKYSFLSDLSARELTLTPSLLDEFLDICMGKSLEIVTKTNETIKVELLDENPRAGIEITPLGNGARLTVTPMTVLDGMAHTYVCMDRKLYRCTKEYSRAMGSLLKTASASDKDFFEVSKNDMMFFCGSILPKVSEFAVISTEGIDLKEFELPEITVKFFIDNPERGVISCRTECTYGEVRTDIFSEPSVFSSYRSTAMETNIRMCLMRYFEFNDGGIMEIREDDDALFRLIDNGFDELRSFGEVYISEQFERLRIAPSPRFSVGVALSGSLLSLELDSDELNFRELSKILKSYKLKKKYHRLSDGSFLRLDDTALSSVAEIAGELGEGADGNTLSVPKYRAFYIDSVLKGSVSMQRDSNFKALIRSIKSVEDSDFEPPVSLKNVLRGFQKTGFRWLKTLDQWGLSGILADEMGLGKTLQIISLILSEKESGNTDASLIVCPASLVYNWVSEIERFAPMLRVCAVTRTAAERKELVENKENYDIMITSYDLLKRDIELYSDKSFRFEVIDEAQYIKNYFTQSARAVKRISAKSRFALTGTPIENRLSELWSIFDYLMPGFLYDYKRFRNEIETPLVRDGDEMVGLRLKRMVSPFILRRVKRDVLPELPEKLESNVVSKLEDEQEKLYFAHVKRIRDKLLKSSGGLSGQDTIEVLAEITRLRQICCDPSLFYENYSGGSAKLETCMNIVRETVLSGHKVLIFSQFTSMLEIIEGRLREEKIDFYTLTGATSKEKRSSLVSSFQTGSVGVFLISLKAGGTGLNLTAADVVIHYDPWWNTAVQNQATDRAHRIGQKNVVTVYKLIAKGTIEENILKLQEDKRELAESIVSENAEKAVKLTKDEILAILGEHE